MRERASNRRAEHFDESELSPVSGLAPPSAELRGAIPADGHVLREQEVGA